ncbi:MAG TPA: glycosyltransferase family 2 protein [Drouetiella sp.]
MIFFSFVFINAVIILFMFSLTAAFYVFLRGVERCKIPDANLPFVSVLIPARNEETKIERCLDSVLAQNYPNFEVIVIDDRSTDRTGEIIEGYAKRDSRVKYVQGKDAPSGWIGKCNALAHAVGYASGDWYIFTDADTYHEKSSIKDAVAYSISNKTDLVSFVPMQELGSFWEKLVMPTLLSSFVLGDPFHSVNNPKAKRAYAYGQYIICRTSSYDALGGHQSVRDEIVEDHAIARVFKEKGYKILVADGKTMYSVRMYTDLSSMWQGWTKNLYSLIDSHVFNLLAIIALLNVVLIAPFIEAFAVANMWLQADPNPFLTPLTALTAAQLIVLVVWYRLTAEHRAGTNWWHFFWLPFGCLSVSVLQLHAAYLVLSGSKVNWKGRQYTVNSSKTIQPDGKKKLDALDPAALTGDGTD